MMRGSGAQDLRQGRRSYMLEACAGLSDPARRTESAARREAEEELGIKIGALAASAASFRRPAR